MTAAQARGIARAFGREVQPVRELGGGYSNESWLARDVDGTFVVLRRYGRLNVTRSALFYEHAVARYCAARTDLVRAPLENAEGDSLVLLDGSFVAALPYVAGETGDRSLSAAAAAALAAFHRAGHGFRARHPRVARSLGTLAWLRERFVRFASDPLLARALDWNVPIRAVSGAVTRIAPHAVRLPLGVVHGDAHPDNVVTDGERVRALIDFDFVHETERAYDVATAADSYARDGEDAPLDIGRFAAFVRAYHAALPLTADEWTIVLDMAIRRNAMLVWYVVTRHGERVAGDIGGAPRYVERLRDLERHAGSTGDLRAVS